MKVDIEIWIDRAETAWLDMLYSHAARLFQNTTLPSHDHTHHMRVWNLGKTILRELSSFNPGCNYPLVEGVLIATFFHDLGMVYSTREDHGKLGSDLCQTWFSKWDKDQPEDFQEILRAIELHDQKDLQIYASFSREYPPEILGILSVADDLEALGTIGIYRYAEIYLQRGIPMEELGERILENAAKRFENLSAGCKRCPSIIEPYRKQFEELCLFFEQYGHQIAGIAEPASVYSGQLGVINYIRTGRLDQEARDSEDRVIRDYFKKLEHELDQARL